MLNICNCIKNKGVLEKVFQAEGNDWKVLENTVWFLSLSTNLYLSDEYHVVFV